ncbi:hypothetical protein PMAYCL1PPCAC_14156, partial [Pristionchus mayeri]
CRVKGVPIHHYTIRVQYSRAGEIDKLKFHNGFLAVVTPLDFYLVHTLRQLRTAPMSQEEFCAYPPEKYVNLKLREGYGFVNGLVYSTPCEWTGEVKHTAPVGSPIRGKPPVGFPFVDEDPENGATSSSGAAASAATGALLSLSALLL